MKEAIAAIEDFSSYMRSISNSLTLDCCVTAEEELRTVKYYLSMEKRRFGKDLQTEFNIEDSDFQLPAFSIQVVAENAVRHGIRKNQPPSGTVSIHTFRGNGRHVVEIRDNGAGFIPGQLSPAEQKHVGLDNVSERLRIMCGGTMRIDSAPEKGTRVRIEIPENTEEYRK